MLVVGLKSKAVADFLKQPYRSPWKWHSARSRLIYGLNRYFQGSNQILFILNFYKDVFG